MKSIFMTALLIFSSVSFCKENNATEENYSCRFDHRILDAASYSLKCKVDEDGVRSCKVHYQTHRPPTRKGSHQLTLTEAKAKTEVHENKELEMKATINLKGRSAKLKISQKSLSCKLPDLEIEDEAVTEEAATNLFGQ